MIYKTKPSHKIYSLEKMKATPKAFKTHLPAFFLPLNNGLQLFAYLWGGGKPATSTLKQSITSSGTVPGSCACSFSPNSCPDNSLIWSFECCQTSQAFLCTSSNLALQSSSDFCLKDFDIEGYPPVLKSFWFHTAVHLWSLPWLALNWIQLNMDMLNNLSPTLTAITQHLPCILNTTWDSTATWLHPPSSHQHNLQLSCAY